MQSVGRVCNTIMFVFLALSTYVQHNDPWPVVWITIYGVPCLLALVCVLDLKHHHLHRLFLVLCYVTIIYLLITIVLFWVCLWKVYQDGWASLNIMRHCEGRDLLGVMIVTVWMSANVHAINREVTYPCKLSTTLKGMIVVASLTPFVLWFLHLMHII